VTQLAARQPAFIDRLSDTEVHRCFSSEALALGLDAAARGFVSRPRLLSSRAEAVVALPGDSPHEVRLRFGNRGLESFCGCGEWLCAHGAALGLLLAGEVSPVDPELEPQGSTPREEERRRREARGASELFEIARLGGEGLFSRYRVSSPSARAYEVALRVLDAPHNGCSCPDFATNLLGTCKHVEAVLHSLRRSAPRRWKRALELGPPASYLHLWFDPDEEIRLRLVSSAPPAARRAAARFFGPDGRLRRPLNECWPELERTATEAGIEVPGEVARLGARAAETERVERRRRAVDAEVRAAGREQPTLKIALYPYQVEGVAFLASRGRGLLADEMGLGKTVQAIAAMAQLVQRGEVRRTLIVCPASLKHQWLREILLFTRLTEEDVAVVSGNREAREACYAAAPPVLVTSYELVRADERALADLAPDLLILDEAQRIKNWRTRTASVVKGLQSRFAFVLTGTPLENRLDDLYSLMQVIDPKLFGPLWRFNEEFTTLDPGGRPTSYRNLDVLRGRIAPVVLRRRKEEVLSDLPARLVSRVAVPMMKAQLEIHSDSEETVARLLAILKKRPLTPVEEQRLLRAFQRMRMACNAAGLVDKKTVGAPKLEELERLLEEICVAGGRKVVIFSEWEKMQALAAEVCGKLGVGHVRLHGGVPSGARGRLIDRFREDPACKAFLSTDAGGVGLNLQVASHVVNLDLPWNPAVLAQRIARVHRLGQREAVNVVLLVSEGSFEERLEQTLDGKRALFAAAIGDDQKTVELGRASMASRIATLLQGEFAASTGRKAAEDRVPPDPVQLLRAKMGEALEQVVRLANGQVVGLVRGAPPPLPVEGALLLPAQAARALEPLGASSPLASAEVLYRAPEDQSDPALVARRELAGLAERKRRAGDALVAAGQPGEALGCYHQAMVCACRSLDPRGDPGVDPAALLTAIHCHLLPQGLMQQDEAASLSRAAEAARAFAQVTFAPPVPLVTGIAGEARGLVARAAACLAGQ
jgi:superfamily II DNA or RNA helicase